MEKMKIKEVLSEVGFPCRRDLLYAKDQKDTDCDALVREDTGKILGVIPRVREVLRYDDLMLWLEGAFDELHLPYYLRESKLLGEGKSLYQEWVINLSDAVEDPDGSPIWPMVRLKSSYTGGSTFLDFGTFRQVCSNGAILGEIIKKIVVYCKTKILSTSVAGDIKMSLDGYARVAGLYKNLQEKEMNPLLWQIFMEEALSFAFKKEIINYLLTDQVVSIAENYSKNDLLIHPDQVVQVLKNQDAWFLYNVLTAVATHKLRSVSARSIAYTKISNIFKI